MLGKILGKKKNDEDGSIDPALVEKISKMNLSDMRLYVKGALKEFDVSADGINEVMQRLLTPDEKGEYYIKADDMDSKKKKAFDLVLLISNSKKISLKTVELIEAFMNTYKEIINDYDKEHKEIYMSRFKKAMEVAMINVQTLSGLHKKMDVLS